MPHATAPVPTGYGLRATGDGSKLLGSKATRVAPLSITHSPVALELGLYGHGLPSYGLHSYGLHGNMAYIGMACSTKPVACRGL